MSDKRPDPFGDRMKAYERANDARLTLPVIVRIDGRGFSKFTKGMDRPYDVRMSRAMIETTKYLVDESHAKVGYTQSDEISLVYYKAEGEIFFASKLQKMVSVLASMAAAKFARVCPDGYEHRLPHFDARAFSVPSKNEATNAILWRVLDARKNAISMTAQAHFSHRELQEKSQKDMLRMLDAIGVEFHRMPAFFRNGTFVRKLTVERVLTDDELDKIPPSYWPTGPVMRSELREVSEHFFPDVRNRIEFTFDGADPNPGWMTPPVVIETPPSEPWPD